MKKGTDVNRNNPIGDLTINSFLFRSKNISLVQYLVEEGVDLSQIDRKGKNLINDCL
ncbi:hypothetical protein H8356DRAFT_1720188 [Neocallimastix lanati (nom. inval.)]|uniref:Uncharacterized protein n=1 Tax=Neocallimastix californiae TaxID=1754190 RepID=A0A1Y2APV4_9FUNG|nr:hypothetical protein H8356DRAFT_1720188 [Neocallimastix sp. JGI-2020a]ORY24526.1 hypothetical protein LY90DRAFT_706554 [Neocallimastix californiae]|eukprot:ORY24526.1 hypothetical protein LY90DRAFT_706554 [Neocallimastix californiae]